MFCSKETSIWDGPRQEEAFSAAIQNSYTIERVSGSVRAKTKMTSNCRTPPNPTLPIKELENLTLEGKARIEPARVLSIFIFVFVDL